MFYMQDLSILLYFGMSNGSGFIFLSIQESDFMIE